MSLMARLLREAGRAGRLVSIDPYFAEGYIEGGQGVWEIDRHVPIDKATRDGAYALYDRQSLVVDHLETTSNKGLRTLMESGQRFHLVYIDGSHEGLNPARDFGLSLEVVVSGGIIMLDDHYWPDVQTIKTLCDRHCKKVAETWKIAAYEVVSS